MPLLFHYLALGALLFGLGAAGFVVRRHSASTILSAGIMFQGVVLTLVAFAAFHQTWSGQVLALAAMVVTTVQGLVALSRWWATRSPPERAECSEPGKLEGMNGELRYGTNPEPLVEAADD